MFSNMYNRTFSYTKERIMSFSTNSMSKNFMISPRKAIRYRNAIGAMSFIIAVAVTADFMTSYQLRKSPFYRYSLEAVRKNPKVIEELGENIEASYHVSLKKRRRKFLLQYKVKGRSGKQLTVKAGATIDPSRDYIDAEAFRYIIARKEELSLRRNPITDLINGLSMAIGDLNVIKPGDIDKERDLKNEISIVNNKKRE